MYFKANTTFVFTFNFIMYLLRMKSKTKNQISQPLYKIAEPLKHREKKARMKGPPSGFSINSLPSRHCCEVFQASSGLHSGHFSLEELTNSISCPLALVTLENGGKVRGEAG